MIKILNQIFMKKTFVSFLALLSICSFSQTNSSESIENEPYQENPNSWEQETDKTKPTFTIDRVVLAKLETISGKI